VKNITLTPPRCSAHTLGGIPWEKARREGFGPKLSGEPPALTRDGEPAPTLATVYMGLAWSHVWGSGTIVAAELHAVATVLPVVSDNGFTSNAILTWTD
jgi:hypothetical protein